MPTIPLLKLNTELAMPEVPKLDRVPRPQIDVRGVLSAMENLGRASQRKLVDERPFVEAAGAKDAAMGEGLKATGGALMNVSHVLGALAQKRQEAYEDMQVQRFHADMRRENERRAAYQGITQDASKWQANAQLGAQKVTKPYENMPGVRPAVGDTLKTMATGYKGMVNADTGANVDKARFADTAKAIAENFDASVEFGDYDTADKLAVHGRDQHYFSEEQMQGMLAQTAQRRRDDQLMTVVQEHPQEAPGWFAQEDKLTEYKMTPWERQEWEHRAQSFWEDHERQSVGRVLNDIHNGRLTEVKQLENWKEDMGPRAYADLSEMLAARRPAGVTKNDPAIKEQTMATIANAKVRTKEVNSQLEMGKLVENIKNTFIGGDREELLGRVAAVVGGFDTSKNRILGPALQMLHGLVSGHFIDHATPKGVPVDAGPEKAQAPLVPEQATLPASMVERVRSIRENLEEAIKTGKLKTEEEATDYVAKKVIGSELPVPRIEAAEPLIETPAELRPEQGVWMSPSLRAEVNKRANEEEDKIASIEQPEDVRDAIKANKATKIPTNSTSSTKANASHQFTLMPPKAWPGGRIMVGMQWIANANPENGPNGGPFNDLLRLPHAGILVQGTDAGITREELNADLASGKYPKDVTIEDIVKKHAKYNGKVYMVEFAPTNTTWTHGETFLDKVRDQATNGLNIVALSSSFALGKMVTSKVARVPGAAMASLTGVSTATGLGFINITEVTDRVGQYLPEEISKYPGTIFKVESSPEEDYKFMNQIWERSRAQASNPNGELYNVTFNNSNHWVNENFGIGLKKPPRKEEFSPLYFAPVIPPK